MTVNLPFPEEALKKLESEYSFASDEIYYYNTHRPATLVQKLQKRNSEFNADVVPSVFEKALNEKISSYKISEFMGTGHVIFFVKTMSGHDMVLRATHGLTQPEKYMDMEKDVVELYKKVGIGSVDILTSDTSRSEFDFDYQIMRPLPGKDPEVEWVGSQADYDALSFDLGRVLAKQYRIPATGWGRWKRDVTGKIVGSMETHNQYLNAYVDHDLRVLKLFGVIDEDGQGTITNFLASKEVKSLFDDGSKPHFIHHDLADHNIRYDGTKVMAMFDWECSVVYDPISDLASAPTWKVQYPRERKLTEGFIAELGAKPDNLETKVGVYLLRTMLWKVAFALKGKRLAEKHVNFLSDALSRCGLDVKINRDWVN